MRIFRLKYIIKDKVDYTNEVISNKQGVGFKKIKFLLTTFEFQQRRLSRVQNTSRRAKAHATFVKQQRFLQTMLSLRLRFYLPILKYCKSKIVWLGNPVPLLPQKQVFAEKLRFAKLLEICRTRNLLFKFFYTYKALFWTISLPVLLKFCSIFLGKASFFPFEM